MKSNAFLPLRGPRRPRAVLLSDEGGQPYWGRIGANVEVVDGELRAAATGSSLVPLSTGEEPLVFVSDGDGHPIFVSL
jgi:hypothetical protein